MITTYCDMCGQEITGNERLIDHSKNNTSNILEGSTFKDRTNLYFHIVVSNTKNYHDEPPGDFCRSCVIDAVKRMDLRSRGTKNE